MKLEILKLLTESYSVIKDPKNWCQKSNSVNESGETVDVCDNNAAKWCSFGILMKKYSDMISSGEIDSLVLVDAERLLSAACRDISGHEYYFMYNDKNEHTEVMKMWNLAIDKARS